MGKYCMGAFVRRRGTDFSRPNGRFRPVAGHRYRHRVHDLAIRP